MSGHGAGWGIGGLMGIVLGVDGSPLSLYLVDFVVQDSLVGGALGLVVSEDVMEGFVAVAVASVVLFAVAVEVVGMVFGIFEVPPLRLPRRVPDRGRGHRVVVGSGLARAT